MIITGDIVTKWGPKKTSGQAERGIDRLTIGCWQTDGWWMRHRQEPQVLSGSEQDGRALAVDSEELWLRERLQC
jgi:hypothetical protein